jgi:hypothetical protein
MKNIKIFICATALMFVCLTGVQAQSVANLTITDLTKDTISTATTNTATVTVRSSAAVLTFQAEVLKISGTVAGSAVLQGRLITGGWVTVPGTSSFTLTDVAAQYPTWVVSSSPFNDYRILYTNTTGSFSILTNKVRISRFAHP